MGTLLNLPALRRSDKPSDVAEPLSDRGEVLMFTGVRYSRTEKPNTRKRRPRARTQGNTTRKDAD